MSKHDEAAALAHAMSALEVGVAYFAPRITELKAVHVLGSMRDALRRGGDAARADTAAVLVREAMFRLLEEAAAAGTLEHIDLSQADGGGPKEP